MPDQTTSEALAGLPSEAQPAKPAPAAAPNPLDALDIRDPSLPPPGAKEPATPPATPDKPKDKLLDGATVPSEPTFTDDLLRRAHELGIGAEEAKAYGAPQLLERTLNILDRQLGQFYQQPTEPEPEPYFEPEPQDFQLPGLDPEKFDDDLVAVVAARDEYYGGVIGQLQQRIDQLEAGLNQHASQVSARAAQETQAKLDGLFANAPEEYRAVLGEGTRYQLGDRSEAYQNRMAVLQEMDAIETGYRATGRTPPPVDQLFQRALRAVHGDRAVQQAERQVGDRLRNRAGQFLARPRGDNGVAASDSRDKPPDDPGKREDWAAQRLALRMREVGMTG